MQVKITILSIIRQSFIILTRAEICKILELGEIELAIHPIKQCVPDEKGFMTIGKEKFESDFKLQKRGRARYSKLVAETFLVYAHGYMLY